MSHVWPWCGPLGCMGNEKGVIYSLMCRMQRKGELRKRRRLISWTRRILRWRVATGQIRPSSLMCGRVSPELRLHNSDLASLCLPLPCALLPLTLPASAPRPVTRRIRSVRGRRTRRPGRRQQGRLSWPRRQKQKSGGERRRAVGYCAMYCCILPVYAAILCRVVLR